MAKAFKFKAKQKADKDGDEAGSNEKVSGNPFAEQANGGGKKIGVPKRSKKVGYKK